MQMTMPQNMGRTDRMVRGVLGAMLLGRGMMSGGILGGVQKVVGGAFVLYSATGFDPLLAAFKVNTQTGPNNLFHYVLRKYAPGQGIHPKSSEQAIPGEATRTEPNLETTSRDFAIGYR